MFKFTPILKSLVWGGDRIAAYKGIASSEHSIGESWELSGLPGNENVVAEGPDAGMTLAELIRRDGSALLGKANYARFGEEFPLLVKFLDASRDLSVQVHPNDELARKRHNSSGKSEMWYIVKADDDAHLRLGFRRAVTPEEYERAVEEHTVLDLMSDYAVSEGDAFYLPSGRIHTIGAGTFLVEIQQPSDITYRIYDYGRLGVDGKPRKLHTELAREVIDFEVLPDYRLHYDAAKNRPVEIVRCDYFTTSLYDLTANHRMELGALDSFVVLVCTEGEGRLIDDRGEQISLRCGETVLVSAATQWLDVELTTPTMKILSAYVA